MNSAGQSTPSASYRGALAAFILLLLLALLITSVSAWLQGFGLTVLTDPLQWLTELDPDAAAGSLSDAAQLVANIVAIAITVVAIVVELAANRYSHRITRIFVTEPVNIIVMSLFIITTVQCVWISATLGHSTDSAIVPNAGYAISMILVTVSLLILLPYFAFVFAFLSPVNIIRQIRIGGIRAIRKSQSSDGAKAKHGALTAIDELQDIARRATDVNDRAVAMASLNALTDLLVDYQSVKSELPAEWFRITDEIAQDPDFVALSPVPLEDIEQNHTWVEVKILRQYLSIVSHGGLNSRDVINLIAINTQNIGALASTQSDALLDLTVRCFNSYLRTSINAGDQRSSYYIMNQYRQLAEILLSNHKSDHVREIALRLQFYAVLSYNSGHSFLLEVAAYDIVRLIEQSIQLQPDLVDELLHLLMDLDQEIKDETQERGSIGVRRAQIQLATLFLEREDFARADLICTDLLSEEFTRLERIRDQLMHEEMPQFWEVTDRGVNFGYLEPGRRRLLQPLFDRLEAMG